MLFSSMVFLWCFLPMVLVVNIALSRVVKDGRLAIRIKNGWLLLASMFFYAWGGVRYLLIMLACIVVAYVGGLLLVRYRTAKKLILIVVILCNIANLFVFKYMNLLASMLDAKDWTDIALPIGISFYTFQAMSYVIDVYRDESKINADFWEFALYVSFFAQLVAGPIIKYSDISAQIKDREESVSLFYEGQRRFCYGLSKKVLIANTCAEIVDVIWAADLSSVGAKVAWLGAISYALQIYFDFSGYSDMAIGIGRMLGFAFKENFDYPYLATSVRDFWRRWHISLSSWFRDYVYIPLGGSREGIARTCVNVMIVFILTGIWHGAGYTFLLWGIFYGIVVVIERLLSPLMKRNFKILGYIYTMFVVIIAWVIFRADNIGQAICYIRALFSSSSTFLTIESYLSMSRILALIAGVLFMGPMQMLYKRFLSQKINANVIKIGDMVCHISLLLISIMMLIGGTYNPFIYFRF